MTCTANYIGSVTLHAEQPKFGPRQPLWSATVNLLSVGTQVDRPK
jgi:hypothetical protein